MTNSSNASLDGFLVLRKFDLSVEIRKPSDFSGAGSYFEIRLLILAK